MSLLVHCYEVPREIKTKNSRFCGFQVPSCLMFNNKQLTTSVDEVCLHFEVFKLNKFDLTTSNIHAGRRETINPAPETRNLASSKL